MLCPSIFLPDNSETVFLLFKLWLWCRIIPDSCWKRRVNSVTSVTWERWPILRRKPSILLSGHWKNQWYVNLVEKKKKNNLSPHFGPSSHRMSEYRIQSNAKTKIANEVQLCGTELYNLRFHDQRAMKFFDTSIQPIYRWKGLQLRDLDRSHWRDTRA